MSVAQADVYNGVYVLQGNVQAGSARRFSEIISKNGGWFWK